MTYCVILANKHSLDIITFFEQSVLNDLTHLAPESPFAQNYVKTDQVAFQELSGQGIFIRLCVTQEETFPLVPV